MPPRCTAASFPQATKDPYFDAAALMRILTYPPPSWAMMNGMAEPATYGFGTYTHTFRLYGTTPVCRFAIPG
jgi:hypothetical protein